MVFLDVETTGFSPDYHEVIEVAAIRVNGRAYERTSLIVTTNLPFEESTQVFGRERMTGALLDRLTHRVHILEANGENHRLGEAQKRLKPITSQRYKERLNPKRIEPGHKTG